MFPWCLHLNHNTSCPHNFVCDSFHKNQPVFVLKESLQGLQIIHKIHFNIKKQFLAVFAYLGNFPSLQITFSFTIERKLYNVFSLQIYKEIYSCQNLVYFFSSNFHAIQITTFRTQNFFPTSSFQPLVPGDVPFVPVPIL